MSTTTSKSGGHKTVTVISFHDELMMHLTKTVSDSFPMEGGSFTCQDGFKLYVYYGRCHSSEKGDDRKWVSFQCVYPGDLIEDGEEPLLMKYIDISGSPPSTSDLPKPSIDMFQSLFCRRSLLNMVVLPLNDLFNVNIIKKK